LIGEFLPNYAIGIVVTFLAGIAGIAVGIKYGARVPRVLQCVVLILPIYLVIAQHLKLYGNKDYVDFAVWMEIIQNIAQGHGATSTLEESMHTGGGRWLSTHFTPLIYMLAIPFTVLSRPETLIICQFVLLLSAPYAAYLYAKHNLQSRDHALTVAGIFVLYPTYQYINLYEFEMLRFSMPLLLLSFYSLEQGKLKMYWSCLCLSLLVREEVAITTFVMGLYATVFMREKRRVGLITMVTSVLFFLAVTQVVMPSLRIQESTTHVDTQWFSQFGSTLTDIVVGIVTKPGLVLDRIADPVKIANVLMYIIPVLFVPVLAWPILLIGSGNVGLNMLSEANTHTSYFLYYLSPTIPFVFIGAVKGVAILGAKLDGWRAANNRKLDGVSAVLFRIFASAVMANIFFGPSPLSLQFWLKGYRLAPFRTQNFHYGQYVVTEHDRILKDIITAVPKEAIVSAEQHILPSLYNRKGLKVFPDIVGADYVVIDKRRKEKTGIGTVPGSWDGLRQNPQYYYDWVEKDPTRWGLLLSLDGYFVYRRLAPEL
jgi:uncharacterized membrane protein